MQTDIKFDKYICKNLLLFRRKRMKKLPQWRSLERGGGALKRAMAIAFFGVFMLSLVENAECAGQKDTKIVFGATGLQEDQFTKVLINGYRSKAKELGIDILVSNSNQSIEKESESVNNFISAGAKAIIIEPCNPDASVAMAKQAHDRGIPVFACAIPINGDFVVASSINDNFDLGSTTGREALNFLDKQYGRDRTIKAALIAYDGQDPYGSAGRIDGFKDAVKDFKIDYVARGDGYLPDQAIQVATDFLTANPDLDIFYCAGEVETIGAVTAVRNTGRAGKVFIFGVDCSVQVADMLLADDNIVQAVTAQDPYLQGQYAVQTMYDYVVNGKTPAEKHKKVEGTLVTRRDPAGVRAFTDNWKARSGD
jgi:ABC-type sugar transport system substrate-binding protein